MEDRGFRIRGLGEIAIRCDDIGRMAAFYGDVLGLERLEGNAAPGITFFRLAEGFGGHTQVLALFDKAVSGNALPEAGARSSLHHIALTVPFAEQDAAMRWFASHDIPCRVQIFGWVGWRGVFVQDPDGNTVELVAFDPGLKDPA